jgi:hypothetical protein
LKIEIDDEAGAILARALEQHRQVLPLLQSARKPRNPEVDTEVDSYAVGSTEEARLVMLEQYDLWKNPPSSSG